jgi:tetratricopeptide (TPR) repeat protein
MDAYSKVIELDPSSIKAHNNLAWLHATQKQGKVDVALKLAKKAKELSPNPAVIDTLGWIYYLNGMYDEAVSELETSVKGAPWNSTILYHLGAAYYKNEQREQALSEFERALKINSNFPEANEAIKLVEEIRAARDTE